MSEENTFTCKIEEMNSMGNGITKLDGCVVFCLGAVDKDRVTAHITENKKNYKIAEVDAVIEPSPYRCPPDCPVFGECGGCTLRHISYEHEKEIKLQSVISALRRQGFTDVKVEELMTASHSRYRNKAVFRFKENSFGYSEKESTEFVPVKDCLLCPEIFSEIAAYCATELGGEPLSYLYLRCTENAREISAVFGTKSGTLQKEFAQKLCERFPSVAGVFSKTGEHPEDKTKAKLIWGKESITESFLGMKLRVSPDSFFQVNHDAAELLCRKAGEYACNGASFGADLYCGTGILGLSIAALHPEAFVTGIEINPEAVDDARANAESNGLSNIGFFCQDSADFAKGIYGSLDFVIIDPPRAGCSQKMIKELLRIKPERIVYVSCEPSSLARDLKLLCEKKYSIAELTACDLFPRTKHIETICLLKRR